MTEHRTATDLETAADALRGRSGVAAVDVIEEDPRLDRPAIEIVIEPGYDRVPPHILRALAEQDCGLHDVSPRGAPKHFVIVAV